MLLSTGHGQNQQNSCYAIVSNLRKRITNFLRHLEMSQTMLYKSKMSYHHFSSHCKVIFRSGFSITSNIYNGFFFQKDLAVKSCYLFLQICSTIDVWQGPKYVSIARFCYFLLVRKQNLKKNIKCSWEEKCYQI